MLPEFLQHCVVTRTGKQTALLLAILTLLAGLQAESNHASALASTTFAGSASNPGSTDGTTSVARVIPPSGVAMNAVKTIQVVDAGNSTSLKAAPSPAAPVITVQPVSQTVPGCQAVTFIAAASGIPAPTYQWQKGGVAITGATGSSYTIVSVGIGDAGSYAVVAANSAGSVTSTAAALKTFIAAPRNAGVSITVQ